VARKLTAASRREVRSSPIGGILADTWFQDHDTALITAAASVAIALLAAWLLDRALTRAYRRRPHALRDPALDTRLRFLRRVVEAAIVILGLAVALSQFAELDKVAASVLASGAIVAAIVGFAARQTVANAVAGAMLALTQPIRIGDVVSFEGETGTVEDVRLSQTYLLTAGGARIIIPNERLASAVLRNDTLGGGAVTAEASVWIGHGSDGEAAIAAVEGAIEDVDVGVAEVTDTGIRLVVARKAVPAAERARTEGELRRAALAALHAAGAEPPGGTEPPG
jgi:small-conductance mechanosensitive channel